MKYFSSPLPCSVAFETDTGVISEATAHYQKRLSHLRGLFLDPVVLELRIREEADPICYENYAFNQSQAEGDIFFGTTIIYPGKVGSEYHLTRGHYHRKRYHAETYQALSGRGLVLFEREDGTTRTAELTPGKVTYVPPFWAHRSVNTSDVPLVFLWTCSVEAGHDYEGLGGRGMRQVVVERSGLPSVEDRPGVSSLEALCPPPNPTSIASIFWLGHVQHSIGFYHPRGGFYHCFKDDGTIYDAVTRHLVSSTRFVFTYSMAHQNLFSSGERLARRRRLFFV